ncbi:MAG TPA: ribonuclease R [Balneolales bacterium]|nr:ribonuclease R [Balneolales bacterium]
MATKKKLSGLEKIIVEFLGKHPDTRIPEEVLAAALKLDKKKDQKRLRKTINKLAAKRIIRKNKGGLLWLELSEVDKGEELTGRISVNRYGTGFVDVEGYDQDIRIPTKRLNTALPGDLVSVRIMKGKPNGRIEGKITQVIKRADRIFVGTLHKEGRGSFYIESDENSASINFFVLPENTAKAKSGQKVVFKLREWTHPKALPEAIVIEVLGDKDSRDATILSILAENQLTSSFSKEIEQFVDQLPEEIPAPEYKRRLDLRDKQIFTIDPEDAKDFDDAISFETLDNGNYELGVHIADVSFYLQPDTILDEEAINRATSVYLVDRVIPMLPEKLSNGVCSLRPREDKLTYSCIMEVTPRGELVDYQIQETVIHSKCRFTYQQAQDVINGSDHELAEPLRKLAGFTELLTKQRFEMGSIDFETLEPHFILDKEGKPIQVKIKERLQAHRLIEECMLLANKTVARHIDRLRDESGKRKTKNLYPFLYRIHDKPDEMKLKEIAEHVSPIGVRFNVGDKKVTPKEINDLLEQVEDTSLEYVINQLTLRAMAKAEYNPKNIGHFGLNFRHYCHFTSPIRRYPDVIVHRLLKNYALHRPAYNYDKLNDLGHHCSERERMAVNAERDSVKLMQVEFLSNHINDEFNGVISGVTDNGLYVDLQEIHCEGMIHISSLVDDYYIFDQKRYGLFGRHRGRKYQMGDEITVRVASVNQGRRTIDLEPALKH